MSKSLMAATAVAALLAAASSAQAANILVNAGFESGSLSPWVQTDDFSGHGYGNWAVTNVGAHSGAYAAVNIGNKLIEQSFAGVAGSSIPRCRSGCATPATAPRPPM